MSDEERDEYDPPREGESEREWIQRQTSPELRYLDLVHRLTAAQEAANARVEVNEAEAKRRAEETQRNMDFIIRQQAQFTADIQKLSEAQATTDGIVNRLANLTLRRFEKAEGEVSGLDRKMEALVDAQIRSEDEMRELRGAHKDTEEKLNAFIATVERLINERRNGGGKGGVLDE
jgi:chromosome segregation ATPase